MAFRPHKFGRYVIVDPIAVGGMAEIYRARLAASNAKEGPDRIIVIKKVIANLQANQEFLQMFEEEIKITVGLTHPNIIQIYDYGKVDDQYFMAMEYVEGKNLRQFVKRLADMKSMFSIDMSAHIISQVCHALSYAHAYKDRLSGKPLGIVHRDISPQNVMISYDGAVKLFDFGIAKAKSASEATRAGVIKGKPSYLSPEQINGEELDGKCDIFALGIVLWELLTAKRLFVAETDMGVLRLIQSAKIEPPSTFNPAVPQALDAIVLKSLQRDKTKRYQVAEEFQRDLHKFLYSFNASFNPADLSYYAQELFKGEIRDDRERLHKSLSVEPIDDGKGNDAPESEDKGKKKELSTKLADGLISTTDFNREMMDAVASSTGSINRPSAIELVSTAAMPSPKSVKVPPVGGPPKPGSPPLPPGAKPPLGAAARRPGADSMVIPPWSKQGGAGSSGGMPRPGTRTSTALRKEIESQNSSQARNMAVLLGVFGVLALVGGRQYDLFRGTPLCSLLCASAPSQTAETANPERQPSRGTASVNHGSEPAPATERPAAPAPKANHGVIVLQTEVSDFQVLVNGQATAVVHNQFSVPFDVSLNIDVVKDGFETARFQTRLSAAQSTAAFRVDFKPMAMGTVNFATTPESRVTFYRGNAKVFEAQTPVRNKAMSVGTYRVVIENSLIGFRSEAEVVVEEGRLTRVEKLLK